MALLTDKTCTYVLQNYTYKIHEPCLSQNWNSLIPDGVDHIYLNSLIPDGVDHIYLNSLIPDGVDHIYLNFLIPDGVDHIYLNSLIPDGVDHIYLKLKSYFEKFKVQKSTEFGSQSYRSDGTI